MKYRISTSNKRDWCTTQLAKLSFNHSIGCTHSWRFSKNIRIYMICYAAHMSYSGVYMLAFLPFLLPSYYHETCRRGRPWVRYQVSTTCAAPYVVFFFFREVFITCYPVRHVRVMISYMLVSFILPSYFHQTCAAPYVIHAFVFFFFFKVSVLLLTCCPIRDVRLMI